MSIERKSAIEWISENIEGVNNLSPEIHMAISDFSLMWSLFEASERDSSDNFTNRIPHIASRISHNIDIETLDNLLNFWKERYITQGRTNSRFQFLINHIESNSYEISEVLLGNNNSHQEKLICIIRLIYRLRNNLFHGNKNIMLLGEQVENINHAIISLQFLLKRSGRFVFMGIDMSTYR